MARRRGRGDVDRIDLTAPLNYYLVGKAIDFGWLELKASCGGRSRGHRHGRSRGHCAGIGPFRPVRPNCSPMLPVLAPSVPGLIA
jgi:hypothetical protein